MSSVLYFKQIDTLQQPYRIEKTKSEITEFIVYHQKLSRVQSFRFKKKILKDILSEIGQPECIHFHVLAADQLIFVRYALTHKIPYFISEHWSGYVTSGFYQMPKVKQLIYKRIAKRAQAIFPVSHFLEDGMQNCGLTGHYQIVANVVDVPVISAKKNNTFTFIVISDMVDALKNITGIVNAFQDIQSNHAQIKLSLIGDGPDLQMIKNQISIQPENIELLGRLENSEALIELSKAHCLVVNSTVETFSIVCLEARAQGLQVIATDCGGPSENADSYTQIIPIRDSTELKKQMLLALKNKTIPKRRNIDEFSEQNIGSQILKRYQFAI